jgi:hypothetical protein
VRAVSKAWRTIALGASLVAFVMVGCDEEPAAASLIGEGCRLNSDCEGGLVCAYGRCHEECATSEDCDGGRCVLGPQKVHLCQPATTATCAFNSDCLEPLICARDNQCRNQCAADRDCVNGQQCVSATCAEPEDLDDTGALPLADDSLGKPCLYTSDCGPSEEGLALVCRQGACTYACFDDSDCRRFEDCTTDDDPETPGECVLINDPQNLVCDPDTDEKNCFCDDADPNLLTGVAPCKEDGSGFLPCPCDPM